MRAVAFAAMALLAMATAASGAGSKARAVARVTARDGKPVGTVSFTATAHGVLIEYDLKALPPGAHAIHIHTSGNCDPRNGFAAAGPHFSEDPTKMHGYFAQHSPHSGDLPNEFAGVDGTLHAATISNAFSIGNGKKSIFDRDGASIIVDARADDYLSQPSGNSGERIACGVIVRTVGPASRKAGKRKAHK